MTTEFIITKQYVPRCKLCGEPYELERMHLGYAVCLPCGNEIAEEKAKHYTIAPLNKSNYVLITDLDLLKQLNPKRTT